MEIPIMSFINNEKDDNDLSQNKSNLFLKN